MLEAGRESDRRGSSPAQNVRDVVPDVTISLVTENGDPYEAYTLIGPFASRVVLNVYVVSVNTASDGTSALTV